MTSRRRLREHPLWPTIDAMLDSIRLARSFYAAGITGPDSATAFAECVLALARAVLGEETP